LAVQSSDHLLGSKPNKVARVAAEALQAKSILFVRLPAPFGGLTVLLKREGGLVHRHMTVSWLTKLKFFLGSLLSGGFLTPWLTCMWYRDLFNHPELSEIQFNGNGWELFNIQLSNIIKGFLTFGIYYLFGYPQETVINYIDSHLRVNTPLAQIQPPTGVQP